MNHRCHPGAAGPSWLLACLLAASSAQAQSPQTPATAEALHDYAVPAGPLGASLNRIAVASGIVLSVPPALVQGRQAPALSGRMAPAEALRRALAGSGLVPARTGSGTWTVQPAPANPAPGAAATVLAPVTVRAAQEPSTTEGTSSYTTRALSIGKTEAPLRYIPQSVSVVTRQQLDDRNASSLGDAVGYVTGLRANPTGTGLVNLESRGFLLDNYLMDGLPYKGGQGMWGSAMLDMALYDRIEVWRGPTGLLEGAGEPSGTINMVRKRAQRDFAGQVGLTVGRWDTYRAEADITGAFNADGSVRGRLVAVHDDRHSFIDAVWQRATTVYGTVEVDLAPRTTLSLGGQAQTGGSLVFVGLPLFPDGRSPDLPRSTFLGSRNSFKDDQTGGVFAELDHTLGDGSRFKLSARQDVRKTWLERFMTHSMVNPDTRMVTVRGTRQLSREEDRSLDAFYSRPFTWRGQEQELLVGANAQLYKGGQTQGRHTNFQQNVDNPDLDLLLPPEDIGGPPKTRVTQYGTYAQLRLRPWQPLLVLAGARVAWWKTANVDTPATDQQIDARFVPNFGLVYDVDAAHSLYGSVNRIFAPQDSQAVTGEVLAPRTGQQVELGVKGEYLEGRVNAHMAVFRITDKGRAMSDPFNEDYSIAAGKVRSQGFEAELSGRLTPRLDLVAGYAYTATKFLQAEQDNVGRPYNASFPRHSLTLWGKYRPEVLGGDRLWVGGGLRMYSRSSTTYGDSTWTQGGYAVASLQAGWRFSEKLEATLTVSNLFDRSYYARLAGHEFRQTYYGEPRNLQLAVRARF